jgi:hypothetical protein
MSPFDGESFIQAELRPDLSNLAFSDEPARASVWDMSGCNENVKNDKNSASDKGKEAAADKGKEYEKGKDTSDKNSDGDDGGGSGSKGSRDDNGPPVQQNSSWSNVNQYLSL